MKFIIERFLYKEHNFDKLISMLDRYCIDYDIVEIIPFTDKIIFNTGVENYNDIVEDEVIEYKPNSDNTFVMGSVKLQRLVKDK